MRREGPLFSFLRDEGPVEPDCPIIVCKNDADFPGGEFLDRGPWWDRDGGSALRPLERPACGKSGVRIEGQRRTLVIPRLLRGIVRTDALVLVLVHPAEAAEEPNESEEDDEA